jgi:peptidoglycan/LPS O-acetylase OafA/YrhL
VLTSHVEQRLHDVGRPSFWGDWFQNLGGAGVDLFFVLSGFLITFLLLVERSEAGRISLPHFYGRRALRIWPLYYAVVGTVLLVVPRFDPGHTAVAPPAIVALYLLILPNVAQAFHPPIPGISQTWSIGVEEQFYLIWPPLLNAFARRPMRLFVGAIALKILLLAALWGMDRSGWVVGTPIHGIRRVVSGFAIENMICGGYFAWLAFSGNDRALRILSAPSVQTVCAVIIPLLIFLPRMFPVRMLAAVAFGAIIYGVACGSRSILRIENRVTRGLGNLSYAMYMLHPAALHLLIPRAGLSHLLLYPAAFASTMAMATVSYFGLELPFLRMKRRLASVRSWYLPAPTSD